ncbi:LysR family transcriptional regulator [Neorhizobium sp. NCHU2750]|uniref:LysR family transcriptional regulator n=1 Tax=Neorhizobium sp. NCHU2750 TaxID=1825976 RepID=UPI000E75942A|nr:LysR family transcriptional regulator [Neorhizobium sp. NCHU2750]
MAVQTNERPPIPDTDGQGFKPSTTFNPDRLGLIVAFVTVAEKLSFAEAASVLNQTPSTVSRKVLKLEESLGTRLFNRTTRTVALTEAGRIYHGHCRGVLDDLTQADALVASMNREPQGTLRVSLPVAFGHLHMSSAMVAFLQKHRKISVDAEYSDRFVDMINEDFDVSVRIGNLPDSSIVARKIATNNRLLVASPSYIEKYGVPTSPAELAHHQCVRYSLYKSAGNIWRFRKGARNEAVNITGSFRCDNSEAVSEVVQSGLGIGLVAGYICHRQIAAGDLVPILPDWQSTPESNVYICYSSTRFMSTKVRSFADFMFEHFKTPPWMLSGV